MRTKQMVEHVGFLCSKANAIVHRKYTSLIMLESTGVIGKPRVLDVDCDHKMTCGITTTSGSVTDFDWSKCVCPDSRRWTDSGQQTIHTHRQ
jgi:hypothetical protein